MNLDLKQKLTQEIIDSITKSVEEEFDKKKEYWVKEYVEEVLRGPNRIGSGAVTELYSKIADLIAKRFYEENYQAIVMHLDLNRIQKMVELKAVGNVVRMKEIG